MPKKSTNKPTDNKTISINISVAQVNRIDALAAKAKGAYAKYIERQLGVRAEPLKGSLLAAALELGLQNIIEEQA